MVLIIVLFLFIYCRVILFINDIIISFIFFFKKKKKNHLFK